MRSFFVWGVFMNKSSVFKKITIIFIIISVLSIIADVFINMTLKVASLNSNQQETIWFFDSNFFKWYTDCIFFNINAIKGIISPVTSIVSISFAIITFVFNNAKSVHANSVSIDTYNLIYNNIPNNYYIYFIPFILLALLMLEFKLSFYCIVLYVIVSGIFFVLNLYRYNSDKNFIFTIDKQFKNKNTQLQPRAFFAYIEIFYINNCEKLFFSDLSKNFTNRIIEKINTVYEKTKDGEKSFSELVNYFSEVFGDEKLSPDYRAKLFVYFLEEYESYFYKLNFYDNLSSDSKIKEQKVTYAALLYTALFSDLDMNEIRNFYCNQKYDVIYRWLFAYYILLYKYSVDGYVLNIEKNGILHDCSKAILYLNSMITKEHIQFIKQSLFYVMKFNQCQFDLKLYTIFIALDKTGDSNHEK